jgi:hypothetical protein
MAKKKTTRKLKHKKHSNAGTIQGPHDWDKVVSAAYQRSLGATQAETAIIVGVTRRTIHEWEKGIFWSKALAEAQSRWMSGVVARTRKGILDALSDPKEYALMARFVAERAIDELKPPRQTKEIVGGGGGPVQFMSRSLEDLPDDELREIAERGTSTKEETSDDVVSEA